eukprot:TRINITY_DN2510_c0_g3_i6.p2 TRINITY_DN2510_c0_g3~~TRINITY_DN2510_c0_g3_i6.p2  ORF type:complete len:139 (-),score=6.61 TRINITY_DN2510_c0_g3_i6:318-734(-)
MMMIDVLNNPIRNSEPYHEGHYGNPFDVETRGLIAYGCVPPTSKKAIPGESSATVTRRSKADQELGEEVELGVLGSRDHVLEWELEDNHDHLIVGHHYLDQNGVSACLNLIHTLSDVVIKLDLTPNCPQKKSKFQDSP